MGPSKNNNNCNKDKPYQTRIDKTQKTADVGYEVIETKQSIT